MTENASDNDVKKSTGIAPIGRFKYWLYLFVSMYIFLNPNLSQNKDVLKVCFSLNVLAVIPFLIAKRAKDIDRSFVKRAVGCWYICVLIFIFPFFLVGADIGDFYTIHYLYLFIFSLCFLMTSGKNDEDKCLNNMDENQQEKQMACKNDMCGMQYVIHRILFFNYVRNKGVRRLCIVCGIILSIYFFFAFNKHGFVRLDRIVKYSEWSDIRNALIGFYIPFVVSVIIQWIYNGFKSDS